MNATGTALAVTDLRPLDGEPRVHDLRLADRLGFDRPRVIRELISRHTHELERHGGICRMLRQNTGRGRPAAEYWLTEAQALLVTMRANTAKAADARAELIAVFMAYRRGELTPAPVPSNDPWLALTERLELLERAMRSYGAIPDDTVALASTHMPIWSNGRRPKWWSQVDLREFFHRAHRQMTLDEAITAGRRRFPSARMPSRSSIHRFWRRLDQMRGGAH